MNHRFLDCEGQVLPQYEVPSDEKLRVYGDMMFLAFRSTRHARMPVATLRAYFEPPVELGQFRIFRFDDVPRAMYTWAHLTHSAERKLLAGKPLSPEEWCSGDRLWIMKRGNFTETEFLFRRVKDTNTTRKIVHVDFREDQRARIFSEDQFLSWAA